MWVDCGTGTRNMNRIFGFAIIIAMNISWRFRQCYGVKLSSLYYYHVILKISAHLHCRHKTLIFSLLQVCRYCADVCRQIQNKYTWKQIRNSISYTCKGICICSLMPGSLTLYDFQPQLIETPLVSLLYTAVISIK